MAVIAEPVSKPKPKSLARWLPAGLAAPQLPTISPQQWLLLLPGALGLSLVCFAEAIGPSRAFAAAHKYQIDPNQEWLGVGASNFGAGLFQGFPIGASLSKSAANDQAGAHSEMSGVIAAVVTALVALFLTQLFYSLPEPTLAAIVIVAVSHMVKVKQLRHLYRVRRLDFVLAIVAMLAVMTIEILQGLLVAVILSLFALVWHASKPKLAVLGRVPNSIDFGNVKHHPENITVPGLLMVRPENGVFFANAAGIREGIMHEVEASAVPVKQVLIDLISTRQGLAVLGSVSTRNLEPRCSSRLSFADAERGDSSTPDTNPTRARVS